MVNTAQKGRRYEIEVKEIFEQAGYVVTRAAASKGPFDLICTKFTEENKKICFVAFIQCKIKAISHSPAEQRPAQE